MLKICEILYQTVGPVFRHLTSFRSVRRLYQLTNVHGVQLQKAVTWRTSATKDSDLTFLHSSYKRLVVLFPLYKYVETKWDLWSLISFWPLNSAAPGHLDLRTVGYHRFLCQGWKTAKCLQCAVTGPEKNETSSLCHNDMILKWV